MSETANYASNADEEEILDLIVEYGWIDGDHHKLWVLDKIVRIIAGEHSYATFCQDTGWDAEEAIAP